MSVLYMCMCVCVCLCQSQLLEKGILCLCILKFILTYSLSTYVRKFLPSLFLSLPSLTLKEIVGDWSKE